MSRKLFGRGRTAKAYICHANCIELKGHGGNKMNYDTTTFNGAWDYLIDYSYFTEKELELVTCILGNNIEALDNAVYARYGYREVYQLNCDDHF